MEDVDHWGTVFEVVIVPFLPLVLFPVSYEPNRSSHGLQVPWYSTQVSEAEQLWAEVPEILGPNQSFLP